MTESDARAVLLIRAFEADSSPGWSEADQARASAEARRVEGERVAFERFLVRRASIACGRLAQRDPKFGNALAAFGPHGWLGWAAVLLAFAFGIASDAIGPSERINILAPPLLVVLVWNLVVYVALLLRSVCALHAEREPGPLRRSVLRASAFAGRKLGSVGTAEPWVRFVPAWLRASGALQGARVALVLHASAAALVVGALLSLYLRGIAFEYRAGWDSTFLTPDAVHRLLALVLGPAAHLSGIALPGVERLAQLRFSVGTGENAAAWIHLYALTLGLAIVLPRVILAAVAAWQVRTLARAFPLPLDGDYFARLRRTHSGEPVEALVLPYSYRVPQEAAAALTVALERIAGPNVSLTLAEPLPQGAEDDLQPWLGKAALVVALFPLTATPERETHGAFVRALASQPAVTRLIVLIDETEFRRRFTGAEGARRHTERRRAWQRLLGESEMTAEFVDLGASA